MADQKEKKRRLGQESEPVEPADQFQRLGHQIEEVILSKLKLGDAAKFLRTRKRYRYAFDAYLVKKFTLVLDAHGHQSTWTSVVKAMHKREPPFVFTDEIAHLVTISKWISAIRLTSLNDATDHIYADFLKLIGGYPHLTSITFEDAHCHALFGYFLRPEFEDFWKQVVWKKVTVFSVTNPEQRNRARMHMDSKSIPFHPESKQTFDKLQVLRLSLEAWTPFWNDFWGVPEPFWSVDALLARIPNLEALQVLELEGHWSWTVATLEALQTRANSLTSLALCHRRSDEKEYRVVVAQPAPFSVSAFNQATLGLLKQCVALQTLHLAWEDDSVEMAERKQNCTSFDLSWHFLYNQWRAIGTVHPIVFESMATCTAKHLTLTDTSLFEDLKPDMKTLLQKIRLPSTATNLRVTSRRIFNAEVVEYVFSTFLKTRWPQLVGLELCAHSEHQPDKIYKWSVGLQGEQKQDIMIEIRPRFHQQTSKAVETAQRILTAARRNGFSPRVKQSMSCFLALPVLGFDFDNEDQVLQWEADSKQLAHVIQEAGVNSLALEHADAVIAEDGLILDESWLEMLSSTLYEFRPDTDFVFALGVKPAVVAKFLGSRDCSLRRLSVHLQKGADVVGLLQTLHSLEQLELDCDETLVNLVAAGQVIHDLCRRNPRLEDLKLDELIFKWTSLDVATALPSMPNLETLSLAVGGPGILYEDLVKIQTQCKKNARIIIKWITEDEEGELPLLYDWKRLDQQSVVKWPLGNVRILNALGQDLTLEWDRLPVFSREKRMGLEKRGATSAGPLDLLLANPDLIETQLIDKAVKETLLTTDELRLRRSIESKTSYDNLDRSSLLRRYVYNHEAKTHEFYFDRRVLTSLDSQHDELLRRRMQSLLQGADGDRIALFFGSPSSVTASRGRKHAS